MKLLKVATIIIAALLLMAACGGPEETPTAPTPTPAPTKAIPSPIPSPAAAAPTPAPTITPIPTTPTPMLVPATATPTPASAEITKTPTPAPAPVAMKGAALLATKEGVSMIREGSWSVLNEAGGLPHNWVRAMAVDDEGRIWLAHLRGLSVLYGGRWSHYPSKTFDNRSIDAIAADAKGRVWVGHYRGLYVLEEGKWKAFDGSVFGLGKYAGVKDIAIDVEGHVWVATDAGVSVFDGSKWTPYDVETSGLASRYTEAVAVDHKGNIWVGHSNGVSLFDGSKWTNYGIGSKANVEVRALSQAKDIAVDKQGHIWVVTWARGVSVFDGTHWNTYTRANSGLIGGRGVAIACDAQGRVWVGTTWETAVFDGSQWLTYTEATSSLVANRTYAIAINRGGPLSLPPLQKAQPGSASGKVTRQGVPLAGAELNICWDVSWPMFVGPTPCTGEVYKATTDSEGSFSVGGIPIGVYNLAIRVMEEGKAKWYSGGGIAGLPAELHIISGKDTYLSELSLK